MKQAHLLSQLYPDFKTSDLDRFESRWGPGASVSKESLKDLGFEKAARWLTRHEEDFVKYSHTFDEKKHHRVFWGDSIFPEKLKRISHPPAVLSFSGDLNCLNNPSVAIVGAREPTELGRQWVRRNIPPLSSLGVCIISGGARGIDIEAHMSALRAGGSTAAILPSGLNTPYPPSHESPFRDISQRGGVLISELPDDETVTKKSFLRRNRLIVGASDIVVIVEAKGRSGTMMTARWAIAENVDLAVVPGSPMVENYAGSLSLICEGATPVLSFEYLVNYLKEKKILKK